MYLPSESCSNRFPKCVRFADPILVFRYNVLSCFIPALHDLSNLFARPSKRHSIRPSLVFVYSQLAFLEVRTTSRPVVLRLPQHSQPHLRLPTDRRTP